MLLSSTLPRRTANEQYLDTSVSPPVNGAQSILSLSLSGSHESIAHIVVVLILSVILNIYIYQCFYGFIVPHILDKCALYFCRIKVNKVVNRDRLFSASPHYPEIRLKYRPIVNQSQLSIIDIEEVGVMTYTAASHQVNALLSIFIHSLWYRYEWYKSFNLVQQESK